MNYVKAMLLLIFTGHIICGICDCLLAFSKTGMFSFSMVRDNDKLSYIFGGMPRGTITTSIILGSFAILSSTVGYIGLGTWMLQFKPVLSRVLVDLGTVMGIFGMLYHVVKASCEWFYIRSGCTENSRKLVLDFYKRMAFSGIIYILSAFAYSLLIFIMIVGKMTSLARWTCIFNPILFSGILILVNHFLPKKGAGIPHFATGLAFVGIFLFV